MLHQFALHDINNVIRYEAVDGRGITPPPEWKHGPGAYGCLLSHLDVVREALKTGAPSVFIVEDDVIFHDDFHHRLEQYAGQLPDDWDAIFFGAIHLADPVPVAPGIARMTRSFSTYAYCLRNKVFKAFLSEAEQMLRPVDHTTLAMQREYRFYCFTPLLAWVTEDYSDIVNADVNHWWLKDDPAAMFGEKIQGMLARTAVFLRVPHEDWCAKNPEIVHCLTTFYGHMNLRVRFVAAGSADITAIAGLFEANDEYAVVADCDIHPYHWEFKASLLRCLEFDRVLPTHRAVPLNLEDTGLALRALVRDINTAKYERIEAESRHPEFCIVSRAALSELESREPTTYYSPARLVRLHP